ncbi:hypothetical protein [Erwinia sp.]|uniref:hypothetical protein n=1 Tax=Erwinia citreus TaxID=558 RepID=UPI00289765F2|nr:hypothetical protein [Erwinia sp.]
MNENSGWIEGEPGRMNEKCGWIEGEPGGMNEKSGRMNEEFNDLIQDRLHIDGPGTDREASVVCQNRSSDNLTRHSSGQQGGAGAPPFT